MRDFFYNKNDVIVAFVIIVIAAFVIYMRVGVIMDYPARAAGEEKKSFIDSLFWVLDDDSKDTVLSTLNIEAPLDNAPSAQVQAETPVAEPVPEPVNTAPADTAPVTPPQDIPPNPPVVEPPVVEPPAEATTDPTAEQPVAPTTEITITVVAGDVGSAIGDKLISAGAITDKAAFLAELDAQNAATKLKQGTFKIPAGSSLADIVKILVG